MQYEQVQKLSPEDFRRLKVVKPYTFAAMLAIGEESEAKRRGRFQTQGRAKTGSQGGRQVTAGA